MAFCYGSLHYYELYPHTPSAVDYILKSTGAKYERGNDKRSKPGGDENYGGPKDIIDGAGERIQVGEKA